MRIVEKSLLRHEYIIKKQSAVSTTDCQKMNERETYIKLACVGGEFCGGADIVIKEYVAPTRWEAHRNQSDRWRVP